MQDSRGKYGIVAKEPQAVANAITAILTAAVAFGFMTMTDMEIAEIAGAISTIVVGVGVVVSYFRTRTWSEKTVEGEMKRKNEMIIDANKAVAAERRRIRELEELAKGHTEARDERTN